jgi:hypothetical protein
MITMQSWMFLSSFESLRVKLLAQDTILSMAHLGARAFDSIGGEIVSTTAFVLESGNKLKYTGSYLRLIEGNSESEKKAGIREAITKPDCEYFYQSTAADFKMIPGSPIAYWASDRMLEIFEKSLLLDQVASVKTGMTTADNSRFVRMWNEVSKKKTGFKIIDGLEAERSGKKWFPYNKGGGYRKWYGFNDNLINWEFNGKEVKENVDDKGKRKASVRAEEFYFKPSISYSAVTSGGFSARISDIGFLFDSGGSSVFCELEADLKIVGGVLCSKLPEFFLSAYNDTINFQPGDVSRIPIASLNDRIRGDIALAVESCVFVSRSDWDSYETSWDFTSLPLLKPAFHQPSLKVAYQKIRTHWQEMTLGMQRLEEENNRIFIDTYGLQDELTPEVSLKEVTLTCNPHYRYGGDKSEDELEALLLADTMRELISYAVGCMFGRYSLDKPGLILANQGGTIEDYLKQIPEPVFTPDEDNVIPLLDADWFSDDITEQFKQFLRVTFGEEHYEGNLTFIEQALNIKGKRSFTIRDYFLGEFYSDHVRRYKKRPIYWLFSSPKGSFNALIYMHRYQPYTASTVLSYLRDFKNEKLRAHKHQLEAVSASASASKSGKAKALKEIEKVNKIITELDAYERDILYPLATKQVEIDLDDGVKVNYSKLGSALKKIVGINNN